MIYRVVVGGGEQHVVWILNISLKSGQMMTCLIMKSLDSHLICDSNSWQELRPSIPPPAPRGRLTAKTCPKKTRKCPGIDAGQSNRARNVEQLCSNLQTASHRLRVLHHISFTVTNIGVFVPNVLICCFRRYEWRKHL